MPHCVAMGYEYKNAILSDNRQNHDVECLSTHYHTIQTLNHPQYEGLLKTLWEKEKMLVTNQHFLLFPQCFLLFTIQISKFQSRLFCRLHMLIILTSLKFCRSVKSK